MINYEGSAKQRTAHLTDDARTYLRAQQQSIKDQVVKSLATKPAQIQKFWSVWGEDRPIDAICLDDLVLKHSFTDSAARTFLSVYDDTISFAGLTKSDTVDVPAEGNLPFSLGDKVNWLSGDQIQFRTPATVVEIDSDEQGKFFLRVEAETPDQSGWIPMDQVIAAEPVAAPHASGITPLAPAARPQEQQDVPAEGQRKAMFPVGKGNVTLIFPEGMSADDFDELDQYMQIFLKREKRDTQSS
jgi:hypothetical protein